MFLAQVQVTLFRPATETHDKGAFAGAGGTGHQELAIAHVAGETDPFEVLQRLDGLGGQIRHGSTLNPSLVQWPAWSRRLD